MEFIIWIIIHNGRIVFVFFEKYGEILELQKWLNEHSFLGDVRNQGKLYRKHFRRK